MSYKLCHKHFLGVFEWKETEIQQRKEEEKKKKSKESYRGKRGHEKCPKVRGIFFYLVPSHQMIKIIQNKHTYYNQMRKNIFSY